MTTDTVYTADRLKMAKGVASQRIPSFDFTKGFLVLFMVLYHWLNYFYGIHGDIYKYLRFLTPSFIFITGFLIAHVSFAKYGAGSLKLSQRLFVRGIKLLILFIALNMITSVIAPSSFVRSLWSGRAALANLNSIFLVGEITGSASGKIAVFAILVPIGYLLILSSLISMACRLFKYAFQAACLCSLFLMIYLTWRNSESTNVELIAIGLFGVVIGFTSQELIQRMVRHIWVIGVAYIAYLLIITFLPVSLYIQMIGACLTTALIYAVGTRVSASSRQQDHIVLLGRYSLFGYIAQIAILQFLRAALASFHLGIIILAISLITGLTLTVIAVEIVDYSRARSKTINFAYQLVFA